MKYLLMLLVLCGGCFPVIQIHPRWTHNYCQNHLEDYHHAQHDCYYDGDHVACVYAEEWLRSCRGR